MKRVVGLALLCLAIGILFALLVRNGLISLICGAMCGTIGYQMFCGKE